MKQPKASFLIFIYLHFWFWFTFLTWLAVDFWVILIYPGIITRYYFATETLVRFDYTKPLFTIWNSFCFLFNRKNFPYEFCISYGKLQNISQNVLGCSVWHRNIFCNISDNRSSTVLYQISYFFNYFKLSFFNWPFLSVVVFNGFSAILDYSNVRGFDRVQSPNALLSIETVSVAAFSF